MLGTSASQASLQSNDVLGQDAYGTVSDLTIKGSVLPVPDLAVGRLVETPAEIDGQIQQFLGLTRPDPADAEVLAGHRLRLPHQRRRPGRDEPRTPASAPVRATTS